MNAAYTPMIASLSTGSSIGVLKQLPRTVTGVPRRPLVGEKLETARVQSGFATPPSEMASTLCEISSEVSAHAPSASPKQTNATTLSEFIVFYPSHCLEHARALAIRTESLT